MNPYLKTKDFSISGEEFELLHDKTVDMLITHPQPKDMNRYYESEGYISHTDASKSFVDKLYQLVKKYSIGRKIKLIDNYVTNGKSLLDVGAGTGDFILAAKRRNWEVDGVEPNYDARMRSMEKGVGLRNSMEALPAQKYNIITLWHVLEHLPDLENQILKLVWHLEEDGTLMIAVPNFKSYDANYYKEHWAAYDVPRHLWHFSKTAIERLFSKHGLKLIKTKPMIFDAFYVALLSEKYKSQQQHFVKAFFIGLWSNIKALKTKEHSSLIYILKKA